MMKDQNRIKFGTGGPIAKWTIIAVPAMILAYAMREMYHQPSEMKAQRETTKGGFHQQRIQDDGVDSDVTHPDKKVLIMRRDGTFQPLAEVDTKEDGGMDYLKDVKQPK